MILCEIFPGIHPTLSGEWYEDERSVTFSIRLANDTNLVTDDNNRSDLPNELRAFPCVDSRDVLLPSSWEGSTRQMFPFGEMKDATGADLVFSHARTGHDAGTCKRKACSATAKDDIRNGIIATTTPNDATNRNLHTRGEFLAHTRSDTGNTAIDRMLRRHILADALLRSHFQTGLLPRPTQDRRS